MLAIEVSIGLFQVSHSDPLLLIAGFLALVSDDCLRPPPQETTVWTVTIDVEDHLKTSISTIALGHTYQQTATQKLGRVMSSEAPTSGVDLRSLIQSLSVILLIC